MASDAAPRLDWNNRAHVLRALSQAQANGDYEAYQEFQLRLDSLPPPQRNFDNPDHVRQALVEARIRGDQQAQQEFGDRLEELYPTDPAKMNLAAGMGELDGQLASMGSTFDNSLRGLRQLGSLAVEYSPAVMASDALFGTQVGDRAQAYRAGLEREQDERDAINDDLNSEYRTGQVLGYASQVLGPGLGLKGASTAAGLAAPRVAAPAATRLLALDASAANAARAFLPSTIRGATAQGGVLGAMQGTGTDDSRAQNVVMSAGFGGAGQAAAPVLGSLLRGGRAIVDPFLQSGRERIVGGLLQRFATDPGRIAAPQADAILGQAPTLAEATLDPGIAQLQRSAVSASPEVASAVANARLAANQTRTGLLQQFAGTEADRAAALANVADAERAAYSAIDPIQGVDSAPVVRLIDRTLAGPSGKSSSVTSVLTGLRRKFFEPYEDAARIRDARAAVQEAIGRRMPAADNAALLEARRLLANRGGRDPAEIVDDLDMLAPTTQAARQAIARARELVDAAPLAYENQVDRLLGIRREIGVLLSGQGDNQAGRAAQAELIAVRDSLDNQIRQVAPRLDEALDARRLGMRPVEQMNLIQQLLQQGAGDVPLPDGGGIARLLNPATFVRATDDFGARSRFDAAARTATGFRRAEADNVLDDQAMDAVTGVRDGLLRQMQADSLARVPGSPTAQLMAGQNLMEAVANPMGLREGSVLRGLLAPFMEGLAGRVAKGLNLEDRLQPVLAEALTNPQRAAELLARLPPRDRVLVERALAPYIGTSTGTGQRADVL